MLRAGSGHGFVADLFNLPFRFFILFFWRILRSIFSILIISLLTDQRRRRVLEHDFEESLGYWTYMTSNALEKAMNEELAAHGITYQQWQVLAWLSLEGGELTQSTL